MPNIVVKKSKTFITREEVKMRKRDKEWARKQAELYRKAFALGEYSEKKKTKKKRGVK